MLELMFDVHELTFLVLSIFIAETATWDVIQSPPKRPSVISASLSITFFATAETLGGHSPDALVFVVIEVWIIGPPTIDSIDMLVNSYWEHFVYILLFSPLTFHSELFSQVESGIIIMCNLIIRELIDLLHRFIHSRRRISILYDQRILTQTFLHTSLNGLRSLDACNPIRKIIVTHLIFPNRLNLDN